MIQIERKFQFQDELEEESSGTCQEHDGEEEKVDDSN